MLAQPGFRSSEASLTLVTLSWVSCSCQRRTHRTTIPTQDAHLFFPAPAPPALAQPDYVYQLAYLLLTLTAGNYYGVFWGINLIIYGIGVMFFIIACVWEALTKSGRKEGEQLALLAFSGEGF